jgi:hypothetical protein
MSCGGFHELLRMGLRGRPVADPKMLLAPIVKDFNVFEQCERNKRTSARRQGNRVKECVTTG